MKNIHVGNLPFTASDDEVKALFEKYGTVHSFELVRKYTRGRPSAKCRGFAFAEMEDDEADAAIAGLNGQDFGGRPISVKVSTGRGKQIVTIEAPKEDYRRSRRRY